MVSLGLQGDPTSPSWRRWVLGVHWKDWCWSWNSSTLATSCEELIHWKRPWGWEGLRAGGKGDDRGWDGWMASPTWWTWVWVDYGSWWWTERPGVLRFMGSQSRKRLSDWTELNWRLTIFHFVFIVIKQITKPFKNSLLNEWLIFMLGVLWWVVTLLLFKHCHNKGVQFRHAW